MDFSYSHGNQYSQRQPTSVVAQSILAAGYMVLKGQPFAKRAAHINIYDQMSSTQLTNYGIGFMHTKFQQSLYNCAQWTSLQYQLNAIDSVDTKQLIWRVSV